MLVKLVWAMIAILALADALMFVALINDGR